MGTSSPNAAGATGRRFDRRLALLLGGAVLLIIAGLVAVPLMGRQTPPLAPENTPEGVVQRFYLALYARNYSTAYDYLAPDTQEKLSLTEFQQGSQHIVDNSQLRIGSVTVDGDTATVRANLTTFGSGELFGSNEWTSENDVLLERDGESWKIVSGFGVYVPQ